MKRHLSAAFELAKLEGIIPALEPAHALFVLNKIKFEKNDVVVVNLSGRGDKDMATYMKFIKAMVILKISNLYFWKV